MVKLPSRHVLSSSSSSSIIDFIVLHPFSNDFTPINPFTSRELELKYNFTTAAQAHPLNPSIQFGSEFWVWSSRPGETLHGMQTRIQDGRRGLPLIDSTHGSQAEAEEDHVKEDCRTILRLVRHSTITGTSSSSTSV